jgi:hypothetical protein
VPVTIAAVVGCLVAAVVTGAAARADLSRKPTAAELSAAAAVALADRWRTWPSGKIFPAALGYSTDLLTQENAQRVGIAPATACPAGLDATLRGLAAADGCRAVLRATYVDQLQGVVYTVGVVAFASPRRAAAFVRNLPKGQSGGTGLNALAFAGTASAAFADPARQAATSSQRGPYVVLTVAGYADGAPAAVTLQRRAADFTPATQLAGEVIAPLTGPAVVSCQSRAFSC